MTLVFRLLGMTTEPGPAVPPRQRVAVIGAVAYILRLWIV